MRALRFHSYGDPADVLRLDETDKPEPGDGQIRIAVEACGLTPADWAICGGLHDGVLPRGIGLEVSGTVDALGAGVTGVEVGDPVLGPSVYAGASGGAADFALMATWFPRPAGLGAVQAAALPMAVETAYRGIDALGDVSGRRVLVSGAGTTIGLAAAQIALRLGARVIASSGDTFAGLLREAGAEVVAYGEGLGPRVTALAGGPVDLVFDAAPAGIMAELLTTVTDPTHIVTATDFAAIRDFGVRSTGMNMRYDVLGEYAELAARGRLVMPIAGTYPLDRWREPLAVSRSGKARGKHVLVPAPH
ncbi:NADP-dependent oxidoreductase [Actinoplanes couchii]|uniref:Oxidoreductase n=1 Tax=Actinoplanes couchii TaxID=403638 RepID=A0ABQ3X7U6_9ACTN|nr:NADP-dependent oxidoreductase [Actinoplanes couchii]MDR6320411.1 NADPH:quinone reductase-like Zn-dependent oxidoreductase [Actinoplanes couchii]GID54577.1 oxidoreductase [Actinoplanes couchii]